MSFESDFAGILNKEATLYTKNRGVVNSLGEKAFSLAPTVTKLICVVQPTTEEMSFTLHGTTYVCREAVYCAYRTDISAGDILKVDSKQYLIVSVSDDGGQEDHLCLYITKV